MSELPLDYNTREPLIRTIRQCFWNTYKHKDAETIAQIRECILSHSDKPLASPLFYARWDLVFDTDKRQFYITPTKGLKAQFK